MNNHLGLPCLLHISLLHGTLLKFPLIFLYTALMLKELASRTSDLSGSLSSSHCLACSIFLTIQDACVVCTSQGFLPFKYYEWIQVIHSLSFFLARFHSCFRIAVLFHCCKSMMFKLPVVLGLQILSHAISVFPLCWVSHVKRNLLQIVSTCCSTVFGISIACDQKFCIDVSTLCTNCSIPAYDKNFFVHELTQPNILSISGCHWLIEIFFCTQWDSQISER